MKRTCFIIIFFLQLFHLQAQETDSTGNPPVTTVDTGIISKPVQDTVKKNKDTTVITSLPGYKAFDKTKLLRENKFFNLLGEGVYKIEKIRVIERKDWLFYLITGLLFFMAVLKLSYQKYFTNLFRLFFKTTLRQTQLKDQLAQSQLSGLLFNIFFFIAAGIYLFLLVRHYDVSIQGEKWQQLGSCIVLLTVLYILKFAVLKLSGWVFGMPVVADSYIFIVFLINKISGLLLVPFIILIAFASAQLVNISLTLSFLMISGLFLYRFIRSYTSIQNDIKVSRLHFFLYLCAFEITPLLLIYKVLIQFF